MLATRTPLSLTIRRLSDGEFRAFIGMLCMAGESPVRGSLMVTETQPITHEEVADFAKCRPKDVRSAIEKLADSGTIVDGETVTFVNWGDFQPTPKASDSREAWRERQAKSRAAHANVTRDIGSGHAHSFARAPARAIAEVEVEGEERLSSSLRSELVAASRDAAAELFAYWQQKCGHDQARLTSDRRRKITARLREGYTVDQIRQAIDGAATGAVTSDDGRRRFDDIELICRNGSKLESFIARAAPAALRPVTVLQQIDRLNAVSGSQQ